MTFLGRTSSAQIWPIERTPLDSISLEFDDGTWTIVHELVLMTMPIRGIDSVDRDWAGNDETEMI